MERAVNKSTSKHVKPLKAKHIQVLTTVTWTREISIADLFYLIEKRMKDNSWVVMLKCLILIHILMREGYTERVTGFIAGNPTILDVSWFRDKTMSPTAIQQTENIRNYATYLQDKVFVFREIKDDFVKSKNDIVIKLRSMTAETGLLVQVSLLQRQVSALLGCSFYAEEIDNVVTLQAFRMLVGDMMALFHLLNEGVIRILGIFFEMERDDAQKAMDIYKKFAGQAQRIIDFFDIARRLRSDLGIDIPHFKHAPVSLVSALETYLSAPDFEAQRADYRERKGPKGTELQAKSNTEVPKTTAPAATTAGTGTTTTASTAAPLIDFFDSIEQHPDTYSNAAQMAAVPDPFQGFWGADSVSAVNPFSAQTLAQASLGFAPQVSSAGAPGANALLFNAGGMPMPASLIGLTGPAAATLPTGNPFGALSSREPSATGLQTGNPFAAQMAGLQLGGSIPPVPQPFQPNFSASFQTPAQNRPKTAEFTVENVFGSPDAFASLSGSGIQGSQPQVPIAADPFAGLASTATGSPFGGVRTAAPSGSFQPTLGSPSLGFTASSAPATLDPFKQLGGTQSFGAPSGVAGTPFDVDSVFRTATASQGSTTPMSSFSNYTGSNVGAMGISHTGSSAGIMGPVRTGSPMSMAGGASPSRPPVATSAGPANAFSGLDQQFLQRFSTLPSERATNFGTDQRSNSVPLSALATAANPGASASGAAGPFNPFMAAGGAAAPAGAAFSSHPPAPSQGGSAAVFNPFLQGGQQPSGSFGAASNVFGGATGSLI